MLDHADHIEASYVLRAPLDRVWHAISDAGRFGTWFGAEIDGPFAAAAQLTGRITGTRVDAGIGRAQKPYLGTTFEVRVDRVEPMRWLSFGWHPLTTGRGADYPAEPRTLVTFRLREAGTAVDVELTITESGAGQQPWTERAISRCLWRPREMALLIEKFLAGAMDQRPSRPA